MKAFRSLKNILIPLTLLIQSSIGLDEDVIGVSDPLQPIWDHLDSLPTNIVDPLKTEIQSAFSRLDVALDQKVTSVISTLSSRILAVGRRSGGSGGGTVSESTFNDSIQSVLRAIETARGQQDTATMKIEQHIDTQISQLETRLKEYIDEKLGDFVVTPEASGTSSEPSEASRTPQTNLLNRQESLVVHNLIRNNETLQMINMHIEKINERLNDGDTCTTLVDKVSELMAVGIGASNSGSSGSNSGSCAGLSNANMDDLRNALDRLKETPSFLPRDCSDHHWQTPEAPSGVFTSFPTMDAKNPYSVYCDMGDISVKDSGGWTVILKRQNSSWGLENFNRTWEDYREGFGSPGEGEWFYGLGRLHSLTYRQPYEVQILMHDIEKGWYQASYTNFRIEDEAKDFSLVVDGFDGNVSMDALAAKHHGMPFSTVDRDNDLWPDGSCAGSNGGGWWYNRCHYTTLTAWYPASDDRNAKTIRWIDNAGWFVFDDVTLMIRPVGYADRFNAHNN